MPNAIRDFLDRYAGRDTSKKLTEKLVREMMADYEAAFDSILGKLTKARLSQNFVQSGKQVKLLKQIGKILDDFGGKAGDRLKRALEMAAQIASQAAQGDIEAMAANELTHSKDWFSDYNKQYVESVVSDSMEHIAGQTDRMKRSVKTMLRDEATAIFRRAATEGVPIRKAYRMLRNEMATKMPDFQFIGKSGRRWDSKDYFEMLTRTVMSNTANEVYVNTLTAEGHDLVKVSVQGAKDDCRKWEGKVLSLTGKTKGYPTLAEAKASNEVLHPRCRHSLVFYDPEIEGIFKAA